MTFKKGKSGNTSGRPVGIVDRRSLYADVKKMLNDRGHDPAESLSILAQESTDEYIRLSANKELLKKYMPDLKAVEVSTKDGQAFGLTVVFSEKSKEDKK